MVPARHSRASGVEKSGRAGPDRVDAQRRASDAAWFGHRRHPVRADALDVRGTSIGSLLAELRITAGKSQLRVAEQLCAASGVPTVTRHEVSRWERGERIPSRFWLSWLAMVLEVPLDMLERGVATARDRRRDTIVTPRGSGPAEAGQLDTLRRVDDLVGGADLTALVERQFRTAVRQLSGTRTATARARTLALIAHLGQLLGWVAADAGARDRAGGALRAAVRLSTVTGDHALTGLALATLGHLGLVAGDPIEALRVVRSGYDRAAPAVPGAGRALLAHRVAYAAARAGQRGECERALVLADRAYERRSGRDLSWAYWLDDAEMTAMAGRCYAALGRHRLAEPLLTRALGGGAFRGRSWAIYATWLARTLLDAGQVERACLVAGEALLAGIRVGSVRAVGQVAALHPHLAGQHVPAAREYRELVAAARPYLPAPLSQAPAIHRTGQAASVEP